MKTLSLDQIRESAPAIFTTDRSPKVSPRYSFVPTIEILDKFLDNGWRVTNASQRGRDPHGRHFIRLGLNELPAVGDCLPELLISNSHDGSTPFNLRTGLHRLVCSNGLTVPTALSHNFATRHLKFSVEEVKQVTDEFAKKLPYISEKVKLMSEKALSWKEQCDYVDQAKIIRWGSKDSSPFLKHFEVLKPLRDEDSEPTLWNIFNIVQEKFVRGGISLTNLDGKIRKSSNIKNFERVNQINTQLWELAEASL
jgi:hypothetical protein